MYGAKRVEHRSVRTAPVAKEVGLNCPGRVKEGERPGSLGLEASGDHEGHESKDTHQDGPKDEEIVTRLPAGESANQHHTQYNNGLNIRECCKDLSWYEPLQSGL